MSFILDALKKSESDHQRQGGPALFEVKVAPPRGMLPPWAIALAVLLAANLGVVLWLLLRHGAPATDAPAMAGATPRIAPGTATTAPSAAAPGAAPSAGTTPMPAPPAVAAEPALTASERAAPPPAAAEPTANPDDYAPAAEPPARGTGHVQQGTEEGVPLYQQIAAAPDKQLPQLRLDLHAYADQPADRWVMVNMHKLKEGDSLPEGVTVVRITPDGAVLSWHGQQFLLTRE
jgi:general secretion pathway protein B